MSLVLQGGWWAPRRYSQLPLHHNNGLELIWLTRGSALWTVAGTDYALEAGQCFYTFPWQEHGSAVPLDHAIEAWWLVIGMEKVGRRWDYCEHSCKEVPFK